MRFLCIHLFKFKIKINVLDAHFEFKISARCFLFQFDFVLFFFNKKKGNFSADEKKGQFLVNSLTRND